MDLFALRAANLLVGNAESAAALEITLVAPRLRFLADTVIALAGADLDPRLDDHPVETWQPIAAPEGAVFTCGGARDGLRAYLAVAGGVDVPLVLGSRSTFTRGGLGGIDGRPLRAGDRIKTMGEPPERVEGRRFPRELVPAFGHHHSVRVVLGPQDDAFTADGVATFLSAPYIVSAKSDRIGCRLEGPRVERRGSPDIISDGIPFGAVQVAGDGLPMILVADRGTTGGYTKIATVISADLPRVAQALPGDRISFRAVSLDEAHRALAAEQAVLDRVSRSSPVVFVRKQFSVRVDEAVYAVVTGLVEQPTSAPAIDRLAGELQATADGESASMRVEVATDSDVKPRMSNASLGRRNQ
jgi:antagonist of KipI